MVLEETGAVRERENGLASTLTHTSTASIRYAGGVENYDGFSSRGR